MKKINMILTLVFLTGCTVANQPIVGKLDNKTEVKQSVKTINNDIKTQQNGLPVNVVESPIPSVTPIPLISNPVALATPEAPVGNNISNIEQVQSVPSDIPDCSAPTPFPSTSPIPGFPHPSFEDFRPVTEGIRDSSIGIIFKDYQKIRYDFEKKEFITKACADVININNLMKQYNVFKVFPKVVGKTEEELAKDEQKYEAFLGVDFPNDGSIYSLGVKNTNIREFVEKLRQDLNVLSVNEGKTGGTAS